MVKSREDHPHPYNPNIDVLLLCTANQCRSPMAEVLLRHHLERAGIELGVSSAGVLEGGCAATPNAVEVMRDRGLDLGAHRSRQLTADTVAAADLIVAMAREHVREVALLDPAALARTFTLKELVAAATRRPPPSDADALAAWLTELDDSGRRSRLLGIGIDPAIDVADPIGRPRTDYEVTAAELDDLLGRLVALLWPATTRQEHAS